MQPHPLDFSMSGPLMETFGRFVTQWSILDRLIGYAFVSVAKADSVYSLVFTQSIMASTIQGWLRTTANLHYAQHPDLAAFNEVLVEIDELRADRNALVHGLWKRGVEPNTAIVQTIRLERSEIVKSELLTVADVEQLVSDTINLIARFNDLARRMGLSDGTVAPLVTKP